MFAVSVRKYAEYCLNIALIQIMKNSFLSVIQKRKIKNALEIEGKQTFITSEFTIYVNLHL